MPVLTSRQKQILKNPSLVTKSYLRKIRRNARNKSITAIQDLTFLASVLTEKDLAQIFDTEKVANLFKEIIEYSSPPPQSGSGDDRISKEKLDDLTTDKLVQRLPDNPTFGRKRITGGLSVIGDGYSHPSFRRQMKMLIKIIENAYDQIVEKRDPSGLRRTIEQTDYPILEITPQHDSPIDFQNYSYLLEHIDDYSEAKIILITSDKKNALNKKENTHVIIDFAELERIARK
jgi:hypothetical protein